MYLGGVHERDEGGVRRRQADLIPVFYSPFPPYWIRSSFAILSPLGIRARSSLEMAWRASTRAR